MNLTNLINACNDGSELAFKDLYDNTNKLAFFYAQLILKDKDDILNAVQNSYVKVFNNLHTLNDPNAFNGWLKTIVRNTSIDILRKDRNLNFSDITYDDAIDFELEDTRPESRPDIVAVEEDIKHLINKILYTLPQDQRICVTMFYFDEMTTKEISENLNISENSVKSRLRYAREKIKLEVLALEKRGTKIYGFAPIPFLYFIFKESIKSYKVSPQITESIFANTIPEINNIKIPNQPSLNTPKQTPSLNQSMTQATKASLFQKAVVTIVTGSVLTGGGYVAYETFVPKDNAFTHNYIQRSKDPLEIVMQAISNTEKLDAADFSLDLLNKTEFHFLTTIKTDFVSSQRIQYKNIFDPVKYEYSNRPSFKSQIAGFDVSSIGFLLGDKSEYYSNGIFEQRGLPIPLIDENPEINSIQTDGATVLDSISSRNLLSFLTPSDSDLISKINIDEGRNRIRVSYKQHISENEMMHHILDNQGSDINTLLYEGIVNVSYLIDQEGNIQEHELSFKSKSDPNEFIPYKADFELKFKLNHKNDKVKVTRPFD